MQDVVEVLSKVHSAHRKVLVAQHASLWVCLQKLSSSGVQLVTCKSAIVASNLAITKHDEVSWHLRPKNTARKSFAEHTHVCEVYLNNIVLTFACVRKGVKAS